MDDVVIGKLTCDGIQTEGHPHHLEGGLELAQPCCSRIDSRMLVAIENGEAILIDDRYDAAIEVLKKCILFLARTSDANGQPLEISDDTKSTVRKHRGRLTGWIREIADKLVVEGRL